MNGAFYTLLPILFLWLCIGVIGSLQVVQRVFASLDDKAGESIQQCEDSFQAQLRKKVAMQDAYLNLRPKDLIAGLGDADAESRRILETCAWKGTIGYEISDIDEIEIGGGFDDESRIEYCEYIYAMLIAPFAVWLAKTGYKPDDAFLKKTLL